ncbi:MAG: PPOX class F420-dependent oxidoreductase [Chloroflexota bacterium]|jgi:hypothetical protein
MTIPESFNNQSYINVTTFRKNGQPVPTPVWFVKLGDKLYTFTGGASGKAKRIRANGRAQIAPSDARGNPLAAFVPVRARIVSNDGVRAQVSALYAKKYGLMFKVLKLANRFRKNSVGEQVFLEFEFENKGE